MPGNPLDKRQDPKVVTIYRPARDDKKAAVTVEILTPDDTDLRIIINGEELFGYEQEC
jgi:hypothetical protein